MRVAPTDLDDLAALALLHKGDPESERVVDLDGEEHSLGDDELEHAALHVAPDHVALLDALQTFGKKKVKGMSGTLLGWNSAVCTC